MTLKVKIKKLPHGKDLPLPQYMSEHAAGDIFWAKSSLGYDTINLWLETYQVAKDLKLRGIVEVIF